MIKKTTIFISITLLFSTCNKQKIEPSPLVYKEIDFVKTFGGSKNEVAKSVVETKDGGYAILGYVQSNDFDFSIKEDVSFDFFIIKYSQSDQLEWVKTYGGSSDDRGTKIIATKNGGFAVIGYSKSSDIDVNENAGDKDFWILKLDEKGNVIWKKTFGFSGKDVGTAIIETNDKGFLVCGELDVTASGGQGKTRLGPLHAGGDFWVIKIDAMGATDWSSYYGGTFTDTPSGIVQTENGNFIIVGSSDSNDIDITDNKGSYDFWVIKISPTGQLLWEKNYGGSEIDEAKAIVATDHNDFVIIGNTRSNDKDISKNLGSSDLCIIKINNNGDLLLQKNVGGNNFDTGNSIRRMYDGGFLLSGSSRSSGEKLINKGQNDAWILKLDTELNVVWQKTIGGSEIDFLFDAVETADGVIVGVGESLSFNEDIPNNKGFSDILIIKLK